ncbi:hypothetical protein Bca52824_023076 [Brassica carinata]|uniref:Uncharacterized protein n=1 Tax=Brassica carinata TaxID=52824 RepID=A0A8X7VHJ0_BRACI|nr:hypothetical protein Bca52824_023076 [Brassica carinata]
MVNEIRQGNRSVKKYERYFYGLPIVRQRSEQELIEMAKDGLKEEIREGLETEEFPTLEALFEEAEEVEEMLKETPQSSPRKRRRRSNDHRASKRVRKADDKGDPEDKGYDYVPRPNPGESASDEDVNSSDEDVTSSDEDVTSSDEDVNSFDKYVNSTSDSDA